MFWGYDAESFGYGLKASGGLRASALNNPQTCRPYAPFGQAQRPSAAGYQAASRKVPSKNVLVTLSSEDVKGLQRVETLCPPEALK